MSETIPKACGKVSI